MFKQNKYYQLVSNTLLFALGNLGSKFIVFILMPLYTNALSTSEYGISELVITLTNFLISFVTLSIQDATLRFALDKNNRPGEVLKNTIFVLAVGSLLTVMLYPFIKLYGAIEGWTQYVLILTVVYMIRNALSIYLKAIGKTKLFAIDSLSYTLLLMISNIVLLTHFKLGLKGYFYSIIISTIGSIILLVIFGDVTRECSYSKINRKLLKEMVVFSSPMIFNNVSWWIINSSDKIMVEYFVSVSASGIYSVASKIPSLLTTLSNIFNQAWIISSISEYDTSRDEKFYSNIFSIFNCMMVLSASLIILIIKPFMSIYIGKSFIESWQYVPLLLLGSTFQSYASFFGAIYTSAKKNISVMNTTLLAAIINIVLNAILIPAIGIQGAVIATVIAYFVVFVFRMIDSRKYINFSIRTGQVFMSIVVLTGQCILMITVDGSMRYFLSLICFLILLIIDRKTIKSLLERAKAYISKHQSTN